MMPAGKAPQRAAAAAAADSRAAEALARACAAPEARLAVLLAPQGGPCEGDFCLSLTPAWPAAVPSPWAALQAARARAAAGAGAGAAGTAAAVCAAAATAGCAPDVSIVEVMTIDEEAVDTSAAAAAAAATASAAPAAWPASLRGLVCAAPGAGLEACLPAPHASLPAASAVLFVPTQTVGAVLEGRPCGSADEDAGWRAARWLAARARVPLQVLLLLPRDVVAALPGGGGDAAVSRCRSYASLLLSSADGGVVALGVQSAHEVAAAAQGLCARACALVFEDSCQPAACAAMATLLACRTPHTAAFVVAHPRLFARAPWQVVEQQRRAAGTPAAGAVVEAADDDAKSGGATTLAARILAALEACVLLRVLRALPPCPPTADDGDCSDGGSGATASIAAQVLAAAQTDAAGVTVPCWVMSQTSTSAASVGGSDGDDKAPQPAMCDHAALMRCALRGAWAQASESAGAQETPQDQLARLAATAAADLCPRGSSAASLSTPHASSPTPAMAAAAAALPPWSALTTAATGDAAFDAAARACRLTWAGGVGASRGGGGGGGGCCSMSHEAHIIAQLAVWSGQRGDARMLTDVAAAVICSGAATGDADAFVIGAELLWRLSMLAALAARV